jgi:hypothetical protein
LGFVAIRAIPELTISTSRVPHGVSTISDACREVVVEDAAVVVASHVVVSGSVVSCWTVVTTSLVVAVESDPDVVGVMVIVEAIVVDSITVGADS